MAILKTAAYTCEQRKYVSMREFGDVKAEGASLLTPSFIIFMPFQTRQRKREDTSYVVRDEMKH